jgi:hypothetical protein
MSGESENGHAKPKTRLRGAAFILRSRSPELARQELFAFLTVCQALCALETEATRHVGIDAGRISFTVTVRIARDHAASQPSATSSATPCPAGGTGNKNASGKQPKNNFPTMKRGRKRTSQPGHLQDRSQPEGILTCVSALTHRHCR